MAEGLEGLSDAEDGSPRAEGSGSSKKRSNDRAESSSSSASGNSSDHRPARNSKATKSKTTGKGKARALPSEDSGSDFQAGSEEEEDDDAEMDVDENDDAAEAEAKEENNEEEEDEDDLVELVDGDDDMLPRKKLGTAGKGSNTKNWTGLRSAQTAYVQTEANMIPPAYRALIKKYAEELAPPIRGSPSGAITKDNRTRALDFDHLPFGPTTPFITRLRNSPIRRGADEVYVAEPSSHDEDWEKRKRERSDRSAEIVKSVTLIQPWQTWEGEGWWPEMATVAGKGKATPHQTPVESSKSKVSQKHGKGKGVDQGERKPISTGRFEWRMRDEVRLGLDHVGRYKLDQMDFLNTA